MSGTLMLIITSCSSLICCAFQSGLKNATVDCGDDADLCVRRDRRLFGGALETTVLTFSDRDATTDLPVRKNVYPSLALAKTLTRVY